MKNKRFQPRFEFDWIIDECADKKNNGVRLDNPTKAPSRKIETVVLKNNPGVGIIHSVTVIAKVGGLHYSTTKVEISEAARGFRTCIKREYADGQEAWVESHDWRTKTEAVIDAGHWESISKKVDW